MPARGIMPCAVSYRGKMQMNHDMVFWGVIIGVAGSAAALVWLLYLLYRNATKQSKDSQ
jgi:hypothetical protein